MGDAADDSAIIVSCTARAADCQNGATEGASMTRTGWVVVVTLALATPGATLGQSDPLRLAEEALRKDDFKTAIEQAKLAAAAEPKRVEPRVLLGLACGQSRDQAGAIEAFTAALAIEPKNAFARDRRGDARLKSGQYAEAVADFDAALALTPDLAPEHWRRGIALYYAGRFADGVKQFEAHKKANPEDVENAAWHYLCNAKVAGPAQARAQLIAVTRDPRVPMAEVQKLYAGKLPPADVLAAADALKPDTEAGKEARFYANLYVALYHESAGDAAKRTEHLTAAVEKFKIGHYMWDVANAHLTTLKAAPKKP